MYIYDEAHVCRYIRSEFVHWALWRTLMRAEYFLFVHHTTSILEKLSTWCFEHSGDISCSLLVNPSYTDGSWERRNTCLWIYIYIYYISHIYTHKSWNKTNAYKLLLVSCFHIHQAYTITLTRYTNYIITKKFKLLSHFLTPVSIVLINIAVTQYDAALNIIIWRFSRGIYYDGDIWK